MALGRGLSSLIPDRDPHSAEDVLERIDTMEEIDEGKESSTGEVAFKKKKLPAKKVEKVALKVKEDTGETVEETSREEDKPVVRKKKVAVVEDFDDFSELEGDEEIAPPAKPLVTPITFEPDEESIEESHDKATNSIPKAPSREDEVPKADTASNNEEREEEKLFDQSEEVAASETPRADLPVRQAGARGILKDAPRNSGASGTPRFVLPKPYAKEGSPRRGGAKWGEEVEETKEEEHKKSEEETVSPEEEKEKEEGISAPSSSETPGVHIWDKHEEQVVHIPLGDIRINPLQPRKQFVEEDMRELQDSIEAHGILQPLVVRRLAEGQGYELVAGERRLRAAKSLGWDKVPCVVRRDVKSDQARLVYALVENIQRENLNPVEEAMAYRTLNEEYGLTHEEIGQRMSKSRVAITNAVRILQLPAEIQRGITEGKITVGHARAILMIPDEEKQIRFYRHLVDEGLTVRKAEIRARRIQRTMNLNDPLRIRRRRGKHALALQYGPQLEERYGFSATVRHNEELNRFEIIFKAHSEEEAKQIIGRLLGTIDLPVESLDQDVIED